MLICHSFLNHGLLAFSTSLFELKIENFKHSFSKWNIVDFGDSSFYEDEI